MSGDRVEAYSDNELECHRLGWHKGVGQAKVQCLSVYWEIMQVLSVGNGNRNLLNSNHPSCCGVGGAKAGCVHHMSGRPILHFPRNRIFARCRHLVDVRYHQGVGTTQFFCRSWNCRLRIGSRCSILLVLLLKKFAD